MDIYQITTEIKQIENELEQSGGEVTQEIEDTLHRLFLARDEKLNALVYLLKTADAEDMLIAAELARLSTLRKSVSTKAERLKELVKRLLPIGETWSNGLNKFSYRTSQACEVAEGVNLPEVYYRTKVVTEVDKQKLTLDLKGGATIEGAQLVTRFNINLK